MKISAKGRYAVRLLVDIARSDKEYVSISEMAERQNISIKFSEQVVNKLVKNKLLISMRGSNGGYKLVKEPKDYSIKEILEVFNDTANFTTCNHANCPLIDKCDTVGCWATLKNIINDYLQSISLQDLIDRTYNVKKG